MDVANSVGMSVAAVLLVLLFITGNVQVTLMVTFAIILVDAYLYALLYYWNLTFNTIVLINIVVAIGLSVDYSAHIAHTYLLTKAPNNAYFRGNPSRKRLFKAKIAISQMGSSVFHGGFSTLLAILALGPSSSYVFVVFFKLWVGIIIFGMCSGFFLLPIMFTFIGPYEEDEPVKSNKVQSAGENSSDEVKKEKEQAQAIVYQKQDGPAGNEGAVQGVIINEDSAVGMIQN